MGSGAQMQVGEALEQRVDSSRINQVMGAPAGGDDATGAVSIIVTIDGPAGTGKSTVAGMVAKQLGLDFLDTGAMYRAATAIVLDSEIDPTDAAAVVAKVADADLHFDWKRSPPALLAWLEPIDHRLRQRDVTQMVSQLASVKELREHLVLKQRIIAYQHPRLVTEGRDQGSVVFPDAIVKFYLDADPEVRALRRGMQTGRITKDMPKDAMAGIIEKLKHEILTRETMDQSRADGPLVCPDGAIVVDTSEMTRQQVVDRLVGQVRSRCLQM